MTSLYFLMYYFKNSISERFFQKYFIFPYILFKHILLVCVRDEDSIFKLANQLEHTAKYMSSSSNPAKV